MIGRLDEYLPVSGAVAFVQAPADRVADAWRRLNERWRTPVDIEPVQGDFPAALTALEPIDGRRELIVPGGDWSALFESAARGDLSSATWNLSRELGARAVYANSHPNLYGDDGGTSTWLELYDPAIDADEPVRLIAVVRAEKWSFTAHGQPQPWEEPDAYGARRKRDRFPPELLNSYLDAIGIPPLDGPAWGPGGLLASDRRGPAAEPLAHTIAELHGRMYG